MIRSVEVVHYRSVDTRPRAAAFALITIATPGNTFVAWPHGPALHLSFDTLDGELEAASLRVPQAAPAVPFASPHAQAIANFASGLQRVREKITLRVCESEGHVRSVTVARWVARQFACPLHEPTQAAAVASCALMDGVLSRVPQLTRDVARRVPQAADWTVQP